MPIRPENRARYPADWPALSARIRERAGQKCEQCKAPNRALVCRGEDDDAGTYMLEHGEVFDESGRLLGLARASEYEGRFVHIVLTVAHLNHQPEDNRDENLRALCQRCHLRYDAAEKGRSRKERARAARASGDLLEAKP